MATESVPSLYSGRFDGLERVEVDTMPHYDLRWMICVSFRNIRTLFGVSCLACLAKSFCIPKDHEAERRTTSLWYVLNEQVVS
jgi:hypothetical protein